MLYLTKHPEVGGEHEVGGEAVQQPAPHQVLRPHRRVEQHTVVPATKALLPDGLFFGRITRNRLRKGVSGQRNFAS
jgi:hypothetical protein